MERINYFKVFMAILVALVWANVLKSCTDAYGSKAHASAGIGDSAERMARALERIAIKVEGN